MAKRSLSQQLDDLVEAVLLHSGAGPAPSAAAAKLESLARIAADLRGLPRPEFKARLKLDLERSTRMATTAKSVPAAGKVRAIPVGYHSVTPRLLVRDAAAAIKFYQQAFGAKELTRFRMPDGKIVHAEIEIGDSRVMLAEESPEHGHRGPESLGSSPVILHLFVEDVDALAQQAVAAGAKILIPVATQFYGDRSGRLADPFGHTWIVSTHVEDITMQELERRAQEYVKPERDEAKRQRREQFHTVTPYVTARQAPELVEFVKQAFGAQELFRSTGSGAGLHVEVRIEDSMIMIGGGGEWRGTPMPTAIHLYVPDTDATYQRALDLGATSLGEPIDQPYGERSGSVRDLAGNQWYIATHVGPKHIPEGLRAVNVYLHPRSADQVIDFMKRALAAEELARYVGPDGTILHARVKIGDSVVEMGEAHGPYQPMPTMFYLYVDECDALYLRALEAGAISLSEPTDQPYGDRTASVRDPFENVWYLATQL